MKKLIILLLAALLLTGCAGHSAVPDVGDFNLELPAGYETSDVADLDCKIVRSDDGEIVGGIEYTGLTHKDVYGKKTDNIMRYLQEVFHRTYDVEYIATHWGNKNKIVSVNLKMHTEDGQEELFTHIFYERYQVIYHMWLDAEKLDPDMISAFQGITGVD